MTLTFTWPSVAGENFGPGFWFQATSSLIGPEPTGTYWHLRLYDSTKTDLLQQTVFEWTGTFVGGVMGEQRKVPGSIIFTSDLLVAATLLGKYPTGSAGKLNVRVINGSSGAADEDQDIAVTLNWRDGAFNYVAYLFGRINNTNDVSAEILDAVRPTYHSPL